MRVRKKALMVHTKEWGAVHTRISVAIYDGIMHGKQAGDMTTCYGAH